MTFISEQMQIKQLARPGYALVYHYIAGSQSETAPLVLIHGWAGSTSDWHKLIPEYIRRGEGVLVYDAAGFGQSQFESKEAARNANYALESYVEDLRAVLMAEGIKRVRLIGHSWGGVVAMCFAARYPAQVEKLAVLGSAYFDPHKLLHQVLKWVSYLIGQLMVLSKPWLRRSARLRRLAVRRYCYLPPSIEDSELMVNDALQADNRAIVQTLLTGYEVRFKEVCPAIECPTLYIGSDRDVAAPLPYVTAFVPLTPNASTQVFKNCGHFPMLEQPTQLLQVLDNFFQS